MDPTTPEGREGLMRYKRELFQHWLDTPCVALGDATPRQAAVIPDLQAALHQELSVMERIETTIIAPAVRMDLDFLWEELGLVREGPRPS
jgi:hypothetical protein